MLYVELDHKMCSELLLYLPMVSNFTLFKCFFWSHENIHYSKMHLTKEIVYQVTISLNYGECLMANLLIYNRKVCILLEAAALKLLLRWVPKYTQLCLATKRKFLAFKKLKKMWYHLIPSKKTFLSMKNLKNQHLPWLYMYLLLTQLMEKEIEY